MASIWAKIRTDFPITKKCVYLDHAAGGPIPRPVFEKIQKYYEENAQESDFAWPKWVKRREGVRQKVARFIHADPDEIAFTSSTSQGMNLVAELLADRGEVLTNTCEFPSSTLPWIWRKAKIVWQKPAMGKVSLRQLGSLLSPSVRTVVTSFVQYGTGYRQDLAALGKMKGKRFLVVNATQGFGAFPIDVRLWNADFLVTNSYKWLMAGYGGGVLYIRKKWLDRLSPESVGWRSVKFPERIDNRKIDLSRKASRYEGGCPSFPTIFGVGAAVDYLSAIGKSKIAKRILQLTDFLITGLENKGFEILTPLEKKHRSGIVIFKSKNAVNLWQKLLKNKIYVSLRGGGIRVAPHFYNSFEEIDKLLKILKL